MLNFEHFLLSTQSVILLRLKLDDVFGVSCLVGFS
jgi:hypothetical protein